MNAAELLDALRGHFVAPNAPTVGQLFAPELTAPGSTRRADAVYVGLYESRGHGIDVCEIKVSRSDFQREIADPQKAEEWWPYSSRFWIVALDTDVAPPELLPAGWGLMVPPTAKNRRWFTVVVEPAERTPTVDFDLLARVVARVQRDAQTRLHAELAALRATHTEQINQIYASRPASNDWEVQDRLEVLAEFEAAAGFTLDHHTMDARNQYSSVVAGGVFRQLVDAADEREHAERIARRAAEQVVSNARRALHAAERLAATFDDGNDAAG